MPQPEPEQKQTAGKRYNYVVIALKGKLEKRTLIECQIT